MREGNKMQCENCGKQIDIEGWVFVKSGGPMGQYFELLSDQARASKVFCSESCMRLKQKTDAEKRQRKS